MKLSWGGSQGETGEGRRGGTEGGATSGGVDQGALLVTLTRVLWHACRVGREVRQKGNNSGDGVLGSVCWSQGMEQWAKLPAAGNAGRVGCRWQVPSAWSSTLPPPGMSHADMKVVDGDAGGPLLSPPWAQQTQDRAVGWLIPRPSLPTALPLLPSGLAEGPALPQDLGTLCVPF